MNCLLLNPHGNDPMEQALFVINFDGQENNTIVEAKIPCQNMLITTAVLAKMMDTLDVNFLR